MKARRDRHGNHIARPFFGVMQNLGINAIIIAIATLLLFWIMISKAEAQPIYQANSNSQLIHILKQRLAAFDTQFQVRMVWNYSLQNVSSICDNALAQALYESSDYIGYNFRDRHVSGYGYDGDTTNTFTIDYHTNAANEEYVEARTATIIENITAGLETDEQKSLAIYRWVIDNISHGSGFGAYQALRTASGAYTAFALLTQKLHDQAGIPSRIVARTPGIHAWNLVGLCGNWYHLDTWHQRYNHSDAEMLRHISWDTDVIPPLPRANESYTYPVCQMSPVANAGNDMTADESERVTLNGENSYHPNGSDMHFQWYQTSGPQVALNGSDTATPWFVAPLVDVGGAVLGFELVVTDDQGNDSTDTMIVIVTYGNRPPVADAGPNMTVPQFATVYLDGSGSTDPDDGIASYHWEQIAGPAVVLNNGNSVEANFIAPEVDDNGISLEFKLTVTDGSGLMASDTIIVNVTNLNEPPVADSGNDRTVRQGEHVTLDATGSYDRDGDIIGYQWRQVSGPTVTLNNPNDASTTFRAPWQNTTLVFEVTVTDNGMLQDTDEVTIIVRNHSPASPSLDSGGGGGCFIGTLPHGDSNNPLGGLQTMHRKNFAFLLQRYVSWR